MTRNEIIDFINSIDPIDYVVLKSNDEDNSRPLVTLAKNIPWCEPFVLAGCIAKKIDRRVAFNTFENEEAMYITNEESCVAGREVYKVRTKINKRNKDG